MNRACWLAWASVFLLSGCGSWFPIDIVTEVDEGDTGVVVFDAPVPDAPAVLQTFELTSPTIDAKLRDWLKYPNCRSTIEVGEPNSAQMRARPNDKAVVDQGPMRCREDQQSGEVEYYPDFADARRAERTSMSRKQAAARARELMFSAVVLPKDANGETSAVLDRQIVVHHQQANRPTPGSGEVVQSARPDTFLMYSSLARRVGDYSVDGPGSRMVLAMDRDGKTQGFVRFWRSASHGTTVKARYTADEVRAQIEKQLLATKPRSSLHVQKIELVYYDGNAALLQPVYRFVVEEMQAANSLGQAQHSVGYVRYADTPESVPELGDRKRTQNQIERFDKSRSSDMSGNPILLGAYITRNDNQAWMNDALGFLAEMQAPAVSGARYVTKQFLPAVPEQFTSQSANYVNSVDLAIVEAHGRAWGMATLRDCCEPVFFSSDSSGNPSAVQLGPNVAQGRLRHLVLHSCSVVASPDETTDWAAPWWNVFHGLTSVVGYRTAMYIDDGAGAMYGRSLSAGAAVLAAWFNTVASLNSYARDPSLRFVCDGDEAMGRPAAISVCGTENATLTQPAAGTTDPATCLEAWWISDTTDDVYELPQ